MNGRLFGSTYDGKAHTNAKCVRETERKRLKEMYVQRATGQKMWNTFFKIVHIALPKAVLAICCKSTSIQTLREDLMYNHTCCLNVALIASKLDFVAVQDLPTEDSSN